MPDGTQGYEGSASTGFRPAVNRILWTGDAGIGASLDDMIAWERFINASRDDANALPTRLAAPVHFANGAPASYGFGLGRRPELGRAAIGHGGALRGWRSYLVYFPAERLSVVVFFNHLSDAHGAALDLARAVLGTARPTPEPGPAPAWLGAYMDLETGLSVRLDAAGGGQIRLRYGHSAELLDVKPDGSAANEMTTLRPTENGIFMARPSENHAALLTPCTPHTGGDIAGIYFCEELQAELTIAGAGQTYYGAFSGFLGPGRMELLEPVAADIWSLPCLRALDHTPPGDWTLRFVRNAAGQVERVQFGCWLARGFSALKTS